MNKYEVVAIVGIICGLLTVGLICALGIVAISRGNGFNASTKPDGNVRVEVKPAPISPDSGISASNDHAKNGLRLNSSIPENASAPSVP